MGLFFNPSAPSHPHPPLSHSDQSTVSSCFNLFQPPLPPLPPLRIANHGQGAQPKVLNVECLNVSPSALLFVDQKEITSFMFFAFTKVKIARC